MKKFCLIIFALFYLTPILADESIKLGVLAPLSGDFAAYGDEIRKGTELAIKELNTKGIKVEANYENACLPIEYKTSLNKLLFINKVNAISHSYCVIGMLPSMELLENNKIISFQSGAINQILNPYQFIFSLSPKTIAEGKFLAQTVLKNKAISSVAIMYLETQWGIEYKNSFKEEWEKEGKNISLSASAKIGEVDFKTNALAIRRINPEGIILIQLGGMLGTMIKQIREIGYQGPIYSTSDSNDKNMLIASKGNEKGLTYVKTTNQNHSVSEHSFEESYQQIYESTPTSLSKEAYDSAILTSVALDECKLNSDCVKERLYEIKNYMGASGTFSIEEDGGVSRDLNEAKM